MKRVKTTGDLREHSNPDNPRKITDSQLDNLFKSMREFGDLSGFVLNVRTGNLAGGHQRVKFPDDGASSVVIERRYKKPTRTGTVAEGYIDIEGERFGYREVNWDDMTEKVAMVAANKHGGEWDDDKLREVLASIKTAKIDMNLTGFDATELERILREAGGAAGPPDAEPRLDEADKLQKHWGTKRGQRWLLGQHVLMCGDSTSKDDVATLLAGDKPSIMVTDPPYGVNYDPRWRMKIRPTKSTLKMGAVLNDDRCDWTPAWALFPGDVAYVWHGAVHAAEVQLSLENSGFAIRAQIIWAKDRLALSRGDYHWQHETCLYGVRAGRPARRIKPRDYRVVHEPLWYAVRNGRPSKRTNDRTQTTLWDIPAREDQGHGHGTQKPVECMLRPIRNHKCTTVYDPFIGSGTTIIACEQIGRSCRAMELSPGYTAVVIQRWVDATKGTPTLA